MRSVVEHCTIDTSRSHDCKRVDTVGLEGTGKLVQDQGIDLAAGGGEGSSWTGGRVVLVPTYKSTSEWKPIAQRML
jgi:2',3'-cyclic-nucleotide 3'-phosphodiesterase